MTLVNVALIPARAGSKRIKDKNKRMLCGTPLVAYSIRSAQDAGIFSEIIVSTDDLEIARIAEKCGASVPSLRPKELATDTSTDIEWLLYAIENQISVAANFLAILRPTSPLRTGNTIRAAALALQQTLWADSLRAMEVTHKHPGKMWILQETGEAIPFLDQSHEDVPTHDRPTQSLTKLWVQNASLEIVRLSSVLNTKSLSGKRIMGFEMPGIEGFDLNTEFDWRVLEILMQSQ